MRFDSPYLDLTWAIFLALCVVGCAQVPANNPYDPEAPVEVQAKARIEGALELPPCFTGARFQDARASLTPIDRSDDDPLVADGQVTEMGRACDDDTADDSPRARAEFVFLDVPAGTYMLRFEIEGFEVTTPNEGDTPLFGGQVLVDIEQGDDRDLGTFGTVETIREEALAIIQGHVRLAGTQDHSGTLVELQGTPTVSVTNSAGQYRLTTAPGEATLVYRHPGYGIDDLTLTALAPGEERTVDDLVLEGEPSSLRGVVSLSRFGSVERLQGLSVRLDTRGDSAETVQQTSPADDGRFILDGLPAGAYLLTVDGAGYEPVERYVDLPVGEDIDLGQMVMQHDSDGASVVDLVGRIRLSDEENHSGTLVRTRIAGEALSFRETTTGEDGWFRLPASRDEAYLIQIARGGYGAPSSEAIGRLTWSAESESFVTDGAESGPLDLILVPEPIVGRIPVRVAVEPTSWLPPAERFGTLRIEPLQAGSADFPAVIVNHNEVVETPVTSAGSYRVVFERPGFHRAQAVVSVTYAQPVAEEKTLTIRLDRLSEANINFAGLTVDACDLRGGYVLRGANLSGAVLTGDFGDGHRCAPECLDCGPLDLTDVNLSGATLRARFATARGEAPVRLDGANLFGSIGAAVDFSGASMINTNLSTASLEGSRFARANLQGSDLVGANLEDADFNDGAEEAALSTPPCAEDTPRAAVNLSGTDLARANLSGADLRGAQLARQNLGDARLEGARFDYACLEGSNFVLSNLSNASMINTDLRGARFTNAVLTGTLLKGADISGGANLVGAILDTADFTPFVGDELCGEDDDCAGSLRCQDTRCVVDPQDWTREEHAQACVRRDTGAKRWGQPGCVRTHLRGANLNGANLVGADLSHADLQDSTLLGITLGDALVAPEVQPRDCRLRELSDCVTMFHYLDVCEITPPNFVFDFEALIQDCRRGRVLDIDPAEVATKSACVAEGFHRFGCQAVDDPDDPHHGRQIVMARCLVENVELERDPEDPSPMLCEFEEIQTNGGRCPDQPPAAWPNHGDLRPPPAMGALTPDACRVTRPRFVGARLENAQMTAVVLNHTDLKDAYMRDVQLRNAVFALTDFEGVTLDNANLSETNLRDANLSEVSLRGAALAHATLDNSDLSRADISSARLFGTSMVGVNFTDAVTTEPVNFVETSLRSAILDGADLSGALMAGTDMTGARLVDTRLSGLTSAMDGDTLNLWDGVVMVGVDLRAAQLQNLVSDRLALVGSDLSCSSLSNVVLQGLRLAGTRARNLHVVQANLTDVDFSAGYAEWWDDSLSCYSGQRDLNGHGEIRLERLPSDVLIEDQNGAPSRPESWGSQHHRLTEPSSVPVGRTRTPWTEWEQQPQGERCDDGPICTPDQFCSHGARCVPRADVPKPACNPEIMPWNDLTNAHFRGSRLRNTGLTDTNLQGSGFQDTQLNVSAMSGAHLQGILFAAGSLSGNGQTDSDVNLNEACLVTTLRNLTLVDPQLNGVSTVPGTAQCRRLCNATEGDDRHRIVDGEACEAEVGRHAGEFDENPRDWCTHVGREGHQGTYAIFEEVHLRTSSPEEVAPGVFSVQQNMALAHLQNTRWIGGSLESMNVGSRIGRRGDARLGPCHALCTSEDYDAVCHHCDDDRVTASFQGSSFRGTQFLGGNFEWANFAQTQFEELTIGDVGDDRFGSFNYTDFTNAVFRDVVFDGVNFRRANFEGALFENCTFRRVDFTGANFTGAQFRNSTVAAASNDANGRPIFVNSNFTDAHFFRSTMGTARYQLIGQSGTVHITYQGAIFQGTTFSNTDFSGAHFLRSVFEGTDGNCTFNGSMFERAEFKDGTTFRRTTTCENSTSFARAQFRGVQLDGADFSGADFGPGEYGEAHDRFAPFADQWVCPMGCMEAEECPGICRQIPLRIEPHPAPPTRFDGASFRDACSFGPLLEVGANISVNETAFCDGVQAAFERAGHLGSVALNCSCRGNDDGPGDNEGGAGGASGEEGDPVEEDRGEDGDPGEGVAGGAGGEDGDPDEGGAGGAGSGAGAP